MEHIKYPISMNYRKEWGEWEAIREIGQNALDSGCKVEMYYNKETKTFTIRDYGEGFKPKHLLIGESEKDGVETIGKFGEGLKFALLVLMRNKSTVFIESRDRNYFLKEAKIFDIPIMDIEYQYSASPIQGTKITIHNISKDYSNYFLSLDREECFKERHIEENYNLYIKGIFVKTLENALFGYNLVVERENPLSGDVPESTILNAVARYIKGVQDKKYMERLIANLETRETGEEWLENSCNSYNFYEGCFDFKDAWIELTAKSLDEEWIKNIRDL